MPSCLYFSIPIGQIFKTQDIKLPMYPKNQAENCPVCYCSVGLGVIYRPHLEMDKEESLMDIGFLSWY